MMNIQRNKYFLFLLFLIFLFSTVILFSSFKIWDPEFETIIEADSKQVIDFDDGSNQFVPPLNVVAILDRLITQEVYLKLVDEKQDHDFLQIRGFQIIKEDETRVLAHSKIPGFLIKISLKQARPFYLDGLFKGETLNKVRYVKYTNLLRAFGRKFFQSKLVGTDSFFSLPGEYLYKSPHSILRDDLHHRFFAISEKINVHSQKETILIIQKMNESQQREVARKTIEFIKRTGMVDAHPSNFLLEKGSEKFYAIDMEPLGLMIEKSDSLSNLLRFKECVLLGLIYYRDRCCLSDYNSIPMAEEVELAILDYLAEFPEINCIQR